MGDLIHADMNEARKFFTESIQTVMEKQGISANKDSFEYLVDLLVRYMPSDCFFAKNAEGKIEENVLAFLYADFVRGDMEEKRSSLRRLGDICLLITGFFPDSLNRKLVDIDYYFGMGGNAYLQLSQLQWTEIAQSLYKELGVKIKPFSNVLGEVSEKNGLQSNADLLRLYERWLLTGSGRLKALLSEHGIVAPIALELKTRH